MGPTETSIAPRQRPKAANSNVLPLATVTPVKMTVASAPVSNGQTGLLNISESDTLIGRYVLISIQKWEENKMF